MPLDPPFNKGRDFHATPESLSAGAKFQDRWSWERDVHEEWWDSLKDDYRKVYEVIDMARHVSGDDMAAFLCFMGVRLVEMHRILKDTGSIYLHCDPTASHYLKTMMDAIFGKKQFRNEIIWAYTGPSNTKRWFPRKHDVILFYAKNEKKSVFNRDDVRVPYKEATFTMGGSGSLTRGGNNKNKTYKDGVKEALERGKIVEDYWTDVPSLSNSGEKMGYPTQKPVALYERIIKASSNPGDVVLDPFCGCATTLVAAEKLGRKWAGVDLWEKAPEVINLRMKEQMSLFHEDLVAKHEPPVRMEDETQTIRSLNTPMKKQEAPRMSHKDMVAQLLEEMREEYDCLYCQGCNRELTTLVTSSLTISYLEVRAVQTT